MKSAGDITLVHLTDDEEEVSPQKQAVLDDEYAKFQAELTGVPHQPNPALAGGGDQGWPISDELIGKYEVSSTCAMCISVTNFSVSSSKSIG